MSSANSESFTSLAQSGFLLFLFLLWLPCLWLQKLCWIIVMRMGTLVLFLILERTNQRWHKQMERYTLFLDWKNQYCENDHTTQSNSQIRGNLYQTANGISHSRTRTNIFIICMETQKTLNSQRNLEKEKGSWRNQLPWPQTILQSYSPQESMVQAQKQKCRPMEQDR